MAYLKYAEFSYCEALIECIEALNDSLLTRSRKKSKPSSNSYDFAQSRKYRARLAHRDRGSSPWVCTAVEDEVFDERFEVSEALYSLASAQGPSKEAVATLHTFGMI